MTYDERQTSRLTAVSRIIEQSATVDESASRITKMAMDIEDVAWDQATDEFCRVLRDEFGLPDIAEKIKRQMTTNKMSPMLSQVYPLSARLSVQPGPDDGAKAEAAYKALLRKMKASKP